MPHAVRSGQYAVFGMSRQRFTASSSHRPADFDALTQFIEDGIRLMAVMEEDERLAPALAEDFGAFFEREATDWDSVSLALDWTADFLDEANGRVSNTLADHAVKPASEWGVQRSCGVP